VSYVSNDEIGRRAFGTLIGLPALAGALPRSATAAPPTGTLHDNPVTETTLVAPDEICDLTAVDLASHIRRKQLSAREVMAAHIARY